jgi:hypothetical protein
MHEKHNHHINLKLEGYIDVGRFNHDDKNLIVELTRNMVFQPTKF